MDWSFSAGPSPNSMTTLDSPTGDTPLPMMLTKPSHMLLSLSDEVIELIVQQLDQHADVPMVRLTCKKLHRLSERHMYRNFVVTLPEAIDHDKWRSKLETVPDSILYVKHLTILNQNKDTDGSFYTDVVPANHTYRIQRWSILEGAAENCEIAFSKSAYLIGSKFRWQTRLAQDQLMSFRWRHAATLDYALLCKILTAQSGTLQELEISMIAPPSANSVTRFQNATEKKTFPRLRSLKYHGLSHTEPIPMNRPARGGRFRMLRPVFRKVFSSSLEELVLSQDHCISQIGKTPLINGRTFNSLLCNLDEIYTHKDDDLVSETSMPHNVVMHLKTLELGGFKLDMLFKIPSAVSDTPRVRVRLDKLLRLVLNECDGLSLLLRDLVLRSKEIRLRELGLRITEQAEDNHTQSWEDTAEAVLDFCKSFKGLRVLSVLWDGSSAPDAEAVAKAVDHHYETLEVYNYASRDRADERSGQFRFAKASQYTSPWVGLPPPSQRAKLREIGFNLPRALSKMGYPFLRLLSQFKSLRTAHIRNFPPLSSMATNQASNYWRDRNGRVSSITAAAFAEMIALPYHGIPVDIEKALEIEDENDDFKAKIADFRLRELAAEHAADRDTRLSPGFRMPTKSFSTATPGFDLTSQILQFRADADVQFANIVSKMKDGTASHKESQYHSRYVRKVGKILGYNRPHEEDKPKLRLLIIGDWRYRDQLNLTGPRTWDPEAWSAPLDSTSTDPIRVGLGVHDEDSDDSDIVEYNALHPESPPLIRPGFEKEWDISLLPIFFRVNWKAQQSKDDAKWRWKAHVTVLEQSTLEGYPWLGDVRSLDFAWQM